MQAHEFWQTLIPADERPAGAPFTDHYPARLADGRLLALPIRPLADGVHGLASLIVNQASFAVLDALSADLARRLEPYRPDVVVGLPTLGLTLAAAVAARLGHGRYVPFGTSRKFWYTDELSVPLSSITTPEQKKRLYVDPRMLPLIEGRRVALVDDVLSSGASIVAGLGLLGSLGIEPVAIGAAMLQTRRWHLRLDTVAPDLAGRVVATMETPLLRRHPDGGWVVETG